MPLQATSGAASYDAFGGGVPVVPNYIEDVFSTWLYTGNGSTQTITNGIDLAGKGGLVWIKARNRSTNHALFDTARGVRNSLNSNLSNAQASAPVGNWDLTAFNSNGFTLGESYFVAVNSTGDSMASWTFREQPKFFDVVTYTGTGSNRTIAHNLGSVPGCIIVKRTDSDGNWQVYHRSLSSTANSIRLNLDLAQYSASTVWNSTAPTSTVFSVGTDATVNASGGTYVAYLFAHDAGGFGLTGTDNVISCGGYTGDGNTTGPAVNLGYEPQFLLLKRTDSDGFNWTILDNMRGIPTGGDDARLFPNTTGSEGFQLNADLTATGFLPVGVFNSSGATYIYIAIRRGPMKTPTSGTSVFAPVTDTGTASVKSISAGLTVDAGIRINRDHATWSPNTLYDRLRGASVYMNTNTTQADIDFTPFFTSFDQNGVTLTNSGFNGSGATYINYFFRRAPGFFDVVCYAGDATTPRTINHNLGVVPELIITKQRSAARSWPVRITALGDSVRAFLNLTDAAAASSSAFPVATYTGSTYVIGSDASVNASGGTYVAYLFASCPGVQYINSYVGDGTTGRTINCGFTGGARFVCIKATSTTGSWWTFDSARGIVTNNDPALQLNSTAAEVTSADAIDTASSGFIVNQESTCSLNASGVTYLVWAIA